jgi:hypothetical protein
MTTEEEVREYCEQRQIVRPHINYTLALLLLFLYEKIAMLNSTLI